MTSCLNFKQYRNHLSVKKHSILRLVSFPMRHKLKQAHWEFVYIFYQLECQNLMNETKRVDQRGFIAVVSRLHNPNSKLRFNLIIQYPLPIQSKERANL